MNQIVIGTTDQAVANLTELARQIEAEHHLVESAARDVLAHARRAGVLLLQARASVPHGNWLPWLEANCKNITPRTAQRYMRLATHWDEVVAKGGETVGLHAALKMLTHEVEEANATRASHLPAALAFFRNHGLINDDSLNALLDLTNDYGSDLMSPLVFKMSTGEFDSVDHPFWYLNEIRPLDHPPLWPCVGASRHADAVRAAIKVFHEDGCSRGTVPQWEATAFWFAATMIYLAGADTKISEQFCEILENNLAVWRESFRTALAMVVGFGCDHVKQMENGEKLWWGYTSDLRHAGALAAALEIGSDPTRHPALATSLRAGLEDLDREDGYAEPSNHQGRLSRFTGSSGTVANDREELQS